MRVESGKVGRESRFLVNRLSVLCFALQHGCLGHGTVYIQSAPYKRHAAQGKKGT